MIRFVDLTDDYWADPDEDTPICAFLSTSDNCFLRNTCGSHTFSDKEEIEEHPLAERLIGLLPDGFFDKKRLTQYSGTSSSRGGVSIGLVARPRSALERQFQKHSHGLGRVRVPYGCWTTMRKSSDHHHHHHHHHHHI